MSFNLMEAAKGLFTDDLVSKASAYLGESEGGISKAIAGILPSVLGGITDKSGSNEGANIVAGLAQEQHSGGVLDSLGNFFGNESGSLLNKGAGLLSGLFGENKLGMLTNLISSFSGAKNTSITSLLSMATPALLGFLGKHATENNLNAGGLATLLSSQKSNITAALPEGLNLGSVFNSFSAPTEAAGHTVKAAAPLVAHHYEAPAAEPGNGLKWLLPILLLALIAMAVLYFVKGCNSDTSGGAHSGHDSAQHDANHAGAMDKPAEGGAKAAAGKLDSMGNYIYDLGETVTLTLPNNGGELKVGKNSTEAKLIAFLNDKNAAIDTAKGNWFELTNVRFKKGSADLTDESMEQLKNMVAISKAYPTAVFKLGGYTDNTGSAAGNVALSQKRADAVAAMVKKMGAAASAIEGAKGYGPEHPICPENNTPECQAQNRRVAVNVKAK
jgi:OmpA-OmpF porin, OOP family